MRTEEAREILLQLRDQLAAGAESTPRSGLEAKVEALDTVLAALDEQRVTDTYTIREGFFEEGHNVSTKASKLADPIDADALDNLDEAVHYFLQEQERRRGASPGTAVSGWVLLVSTQSIRVPRPGSSPLHTGGTYAVGPQTALPTAVGIATAGAEMLSRILSKEMSDDH